MKLNSIKEIFFEYLKTTYNNSKYIFHVTSDYYKYDIISNGLKSAYTITQTQINDLEILLTNDPDFKSLNITPKSSNSIYQPKKIMCEIKSSYNSVTSKNTISFFKNFSDINEFLKEELKGGQYLKNIKEVVAGIEKTIIQHNNSYTNLNSNLIEMMKYVRNINNSNFLVCVIDSSNLKDISQDDDARFTIEQSNNSNIIKIEEIIEL